MLQSVLEGFPEADLSASIVWIDMLPADSAKRAAEAAALFTDSRVRQYHDPRDRRLAGDAFGALLLYPDTGPAWDIYMFFDQNAAWVDRPPRPTEWVHQLSGGRRADPERCVTGQKLVEELRATMRRMLARAAEKPAGPDM